MIKIENNQTSCDRNNDDYIFVHYSTAKELGIKTGIEFESSIAKFQTEDYVDYRNDICQHFCGFHCRVIA